MPKCINTYYIHPSRTTFLQCAVAQKTSRPEVFQAFCLNLQAQLFVALRLINIHERANLVWSLGVIYFVCTSHRETAGFSKQHSLIDTLSLRREVLDLHLDITFKQYVKFIIIFTLNEFLNHKNQKRQSLRV